MDQVEVKKDEFGKRLLACDLSMFSKVKWDGSSVYFEKEWPRPSNNKHNIGLKVLLPEAYVRDRRAFWVTGLKDFVQRMSEEIDGIKRASDEKLITMEAVLDV